MTLRRNRPLWGIVLILIIAATACSLSSGNTNSNGNQGTTGKKEEPPDTTIIQDPSNENQSGNQTTTQEPSDENSLDGQSITPTPTNEFGAVTIDLVNLGNGIRVVAPRELDLQNAVTQTGITRVLTPAELLERQQFVFQPSFDMDNDEDIPTYSSQNMLIPNLKGCDPILFQADIVDGAGNVVPDNSIEDYEMVSLLNCKGVNYVSPVKKQVGGTCGTYARAATLEIILGLSFNQHRSPAMTEEHPVEDFSPINLSEGYDLYTLVTAFSKDDLPEITGQKDTNLWQAASLDSFYPDPEFYPSWWDWNQPKVDALGKRYESVDTCQNLIKPHPSSWEGLGNLWENRWRDDLYRQLPMVNCLMSAAKQNEFIFYSPIQKFEVDTDICVDIFSGDNVRCSEVDPYGNPGDPYQVDYHAVDQQIKGFLTNGYPVMMSFEWFWESGFVIETDNPYYEFEVIKPRPNSDYEFSYDKGFTIDEKYAGHWVVIVGVLEGVNENQGNDFWIIKNSHGNRVNGEDSFLLMKTPSTSGQIDEDDSTKRNLYLGNSRCTGICDQIKATYRTYLGIEFTKLDPEIDNNIEALATSDDSLALNDLDNDQVIDIFDNCPVDANPGQEDRDKDFVGDACDACPDLYDRYQYASDPNLYLNDYNNDGEPDVCQEASTEPAGLNIFAASGRSFGPVTHTWEVGEKIGNSNWGFKPDQELAGVGDFDGDGRDDFILRSDWGLLLVRVSGLGYQKLGSMAHKDKHESGWSLHKDDPILGVLDSNGDGIDEILVKDAEGLGIGFLEYGGGGQQDPGSEVTVDKLHIKKFYANNIGDFSIDENVTFEGIGDFNRDGKEDFILRNSSGLGIFMALDGFLHETKIEVAAGQRYPVTENYNWTYLGGRVHAVGDFNGNRYDDIVLSDNLGRFAILSPMRNNMVLMTFFGGTDAVIGTYPLDTGTEEIAAAGDFYGDNKDELLLRNSYGLALVEVMQDNRLQARDVVPYGTRMGDWLLGRDDQILLVGDFEGGQFSGGYGDDFLIKSDWGFGIISLTRNQLSTFVLYPNWTLLDNWYLRADLRFVAAGTFTSTEIESVIVVP